MLLEEIYLETYAEFGKKRFSAHDFVKLHKLSLASSKVLIHRLTKNNQLLRAGRGEYVVLRPINFLKLKQLERKNKKLYRLSLELFRMFPELKALVLFGSMIRGQADRFSDYDALLILEEKTEETAEVRQKIEKKLAIKLHLTIYSEKGYKNALLSEPYIRFWLAEGIKFDEVKIFQSPPPPVPKMAYEEWLSTARIYMENAKEAEHPGKKCKYYFTALEVLGGIRAALRMVYDFGLVRQRLVQLINGQRIMKIRAMKPLDAKDAKLLEKLCKTEFHMIDVLLNEMGDNEADIFWKAQLSRSVNE
jgi:predicted nucleotidyltransferase